MYRVYLNQNGWKKVSEPEGEDKLLQVLDYFDGQDIMVVKQTDRDEVIFNSVIDNYNEFRTNMLKNMSCVELKKGIIRLNRKKNKNGKRN